MARNLAVGRKCLCNALTANIALGLDRPYSEVAGVVGFYSFFSTQPRGKHLIRVCDGTACHLRGAVNLRDEITRQLGIREGETTDDLSIVIEGRVSLSMRLLDLCTGSGCVAIALALELVAILPRGIVHKTL